MIDLWIFKWFKYALNMIWRNLYSSRMRVILGPQPRQTELTLLLTYSMEQSPSWEANLFTGSQEVPRILWNRRIHCRIQKCPQTVPILSHLDPFHIPTSHILKSRLNSFLPSTSGSSKWSLSIRFLHQNPVYTFHLLHTCYMPPAHLILFDLITRKTLGDEYSSLVMLK